MGIPHPVPSSKAQEVLLATFLEYDSQTFYLNTQRIIACTAKQTAPHDLPLNSF